MGGSARPGRHREIGPLSRSVRSARSARSVDWVRRRCDQLDQACRLRMSGRVDDFIGNHELWCHTALLLKIVNFSSPRGFPIHLFTTGAPARVDMPLERRTPGYTRAQAADEGRAGSWSYAGAHGGPYKRVPAGALRAGGECHRTGAPPLRGEHWGPRQERPPGGISLGGRSYHGPDRSARGTRHERTEEERAFEPPRVSRRIRPRRRTPHRRTSRCCRMRSRRSSNRYRPPTSCGTNATAGRSAPTTQSSWCCSGRWPR